jgi:hypothetical protein
MASPSNQPSHGICAELFQNMTSATQTSFYRDGSYDGRLSFNLEPRQMPVHNARRLLPPAQRALVKTALDFFGHEQAVRDY